MTRESFVFFLGLLVFSVPFLGIPNDWKYYIFIIAGILLMLFGYSLRRAAFLRSIEGTKGERRGDAFVENLPKKNSDIVQSE